MHLLNQVCKRLILVDRIECVNVRVPAPDVAYAP